MEKDILGIFGEGLFGLDSKYPSAVLESTSSEALYEASRTTSRAIEILGLLDYGNVYYVQRRNSGETLYGLLKNKAFSKTLNLGAYRIQYLLTDLHVERFRTLYNYLFLKNVGMESLYIAPGRIKIAHDRYRLSLFSTDSIEPRVSYSVAALEALFGDPGPEAIRRVLQRACLLLDYLGRNSLDAFKLLKRFYDLRSVYVHGGSFNEKGRAFAVNNINRLEDYVRLCLLALVQIRGGVDKEDDFNELLDESMVSNSSRALLANLVATRVLVS